MSDRHAATTPHTAATTQDEDVLEHDDYDQLDDEDWLDMDASHSKATPVRQPTVVSADDHRVPSLASNSLSDMNRMAEGASFHATAPASGASAAPSSSVTASTGPTITAARRPTTVPATTVPFSLTVSTDDTPGLQAQGHGPGSTSPSSSSDSEFFVLNPSAEQSRKSSLSGPSGLSSLTPSYATLSAAHHSQIQHGVEHRVQDHDNDNDYDQDQDQDQEQELYDQQTLAAATSPSFSDFVRIGSEQGEDFSGLESVSVRSSNNETPSSASSEGRVAVEEGEHGEDDDATVPIQHSSIGSGELEDHRIADGTEAAVSAHERAASILVIPTPLSPPTVTPATKRTVYRTTVEDATSSSEDEGRRRIAQVSGMRRRGAREQPHDREDIRQSFFTTARATSSMPGAFNVGLDAEIPRYGGSPAEAAAPAAVNDPPVDERQCRICLGGADEEDTLGRLISPCLCKGSMKYVHVECLNAWRAKSPKKESHYKCDTCKYSFSFRRTSFARYLAHPLTVFALTIIVFVVSVFLAGFAMKLLLYFLMDEPQELFYPADLDEYSEDELLQLRKSMLILRTPESLRAVFRIDKTHMVFGSFFVSIIGFVQLLLSTLWMGGGGGVFRIGGFGLGGGRRRGAGGERQREAGVGGVLMVVILVFGLFKSVYMSYQFVHRQSRRVLAKAEMMVLEVQ